MEPILLKLGIEVRQAVHHVMGLIELVAEEPLSEKQHERLSQCRTCADQLLRTAGDLAELAENHASPPKVESFPVASVVGQTVDLMSLLALHKDLRFACTIDPAIPPTLSGEPLLLQDILHRLLDNAIRFTGAGEVRLAVQWTPDPMALSLEIADTGPGLPPELLPDSGALSSALEASGLGLRIIQKRLEHLNGKLTIVSSSPSGTTLRVTIPMSVAGTVDSPPAANGTADIPVETPLKVLVAEDSDHSFRLFQAFTASGGHTISRALNGSEAVEMAKSGNYDLIVMDVHMPVMDGYTATRMIREWETEQGRARLPIVLLSADDPKRQARMGGAAGCSGYLNKPTTKVQVQRALSYYTRPALSNARA